ncbi:MAG: PAS domain S-box protein [Deltaproteobacteria bacterium]|nr:PAS domain S-box protein [Deltaproteobacteria bacterium]
MGELSLGGMIAGLAGATWWLETQRDARSGVLWTFGWLFLLVSACLIVLGGGTAWSLRAIHLVGPYFPALMLAGVLSYRGRSVPGWLLPAAFVVGVLRCGLAVAGFPGLESAVALLLEPSALIAAAYLAYRATEPNSKPSSQRWLASSLLALAAVEASGSIAMIVGSGLGTAHLVSWALVGPLAVLAQLRINDESAQRRERKVAQALSENEERYCALTENSFELISEIDSKGRFRYLNGRCEHWFERSRESLIGSRAIDLVHPEDRDQTRSWFSARQQANDEKLLTIRVPRRRGECRWVEVSARTFSSEGESRLAVSARDVTERFELSARLERINEQLEERVERRNAQLHAAVARLEEQIAERTHIENELRTSEERWRNVSELSSDMSFALERTSDGRLHADWITHAISRMTGLSMDDLEAGAWRALIHPDDFEMVSEHLSQIQPGETREFVVRISTPLQNRRWLRTRLVCKPTQTPGTVQVLGVGHDITAAREAAEAQRRLDTHFQESQKLESLGLLAGGLAHDFNNALAVILGNAALALSELESGSRAAQQLERIRSAGEHAEALTRQMLTYSGKATVSLKPLDLRRLVDDMANLLEAAIPSTCQLNIAAVKGCTLIEGEPTQLQQIVMNMVTNASEAVGDQPSRIAVRTGAMLADSDYLEDTHGTAGLEPGRFVFLEVSDPGKGIDEEIRNRIFEPFFSTKFTGRGLGLASVLGIVRGHGGAIKLITEPGNGTRFRVLFPPAPVEVRAKRNGSAVTP